MKGKILRTAAAVLAVYMFASIPSALAEIGYSYSYTYNYDYWGTLRESPDAYRVASVLDSTALGLDKPISKPESLFVKGEEIYLCDTGNNRILVIGRDRDSFRVLRTIDSFTGGEEPRTFSGPQDIYVADNGDMFICDTNNNRVLKLDRGSGFLMAVTKPADQTFDQNAAFLPTRIVADSTGRMFVLVRNVNKGFAKFEKDGVFTGFIGASPVAYTMYDQIWRVLSTRAQREQQISFVPTQYDNIYIDRDGFIYAVTTNFSEYDLMSDMAKPIRKINAVGTDILVKNGEFPPIGDIDWGAAGGYNGPSQLLDITVLDNEVYIAADNTRGRLFGYDDQGRNLWAFGGAGNSDGYFRNIVSVEHMGYDLLALDSLENSITLFVPTEYGALIYLATEQYRSGDYQASAESWKKVLRLNGNYELAYIGIGRALLREEKFEQAMGYFKLANDEINYSKAYQEYRKLWVEDHIGILIAGLIIVLAVPLAAGKIRRIRMELDEA